MMRRRHRPSIGSPVKSMRCCAHERFPMKTCFLSTHPWLRLAILALVSLRFHAALAAPPTARALPSLMPAPETALKHAAELGLTAAQQSQLESGLGALQTAAQK